MLVHHSKKFAAKSEANTSASSIDMALVPMQMWQWNYLAIVIVAVLYRRTVNHGP